MAFLVFGTYFLSKTRSTAILRKKTTEDVIQAVDDGLKPHVKHLKRAVTEEDILRLLDIRLCAFLSLTVIKLRIKLKL
jgi:topoisomerase-4 subunit A